MLQLVVAGGIAFLLLREARKSDREKPTPEPPEPEPEPQPEPEPRPPQEVGEDVFRWSPAEGSGDNTVWTYQRGVRYSDGTESMGSEYVVIGNATHTEFYRANARGGTINIPWEATGRSDKRDSQNVIVFGSIDDAVAFLEEEEEDDPNRPEKPEPPSGGKPPMPGLPRPDYGLGGGGSSLFQNGGL